MSIRWMGVIAWVASMSLVWAVFIPAMISGTGLALVTVLGFLLVWTTLTTAMRPPRSVTQVIADTESGNGACRCEADSIAILAL